MALSLAQRIFDSAHDAKTSNSGQHAANVKSVFARNVNRGLDPKTSMQIAALIKPMTEHLPELADDLRDAMKFSIDKNVADAIEKMHKTPEDTMLKALKFAKLPFPKTWIEYSTQDGHLKTGWLIEEYGDGLSIKAVISTSTLNHIPNYHPGSAHYFVNETGFYKHPDVKTPNSLSQGMKDTDDHNQVSQSKMAIIVLLLLNSRSNVLKISSHGRNDEQRINRKLKQKNKPAKAFLNKIRFDVARIVRKDPKISKIEAAKIMATSLVRGHFKIRKTGVFFWSPHVRGAKEEEKPDVVSQQLQRERQTKKSGPASLPHFRA